MSASDNYQAAEAPQKKVLPPLNDEQVSVTKTPSKSPPIFS